jgi:hypothetical protein
MKTALDSIEPGLLRDCLDDRMEPLAHGAIRSWHLGDLREHGGG